MKKSFRIFNIIVSDGITQKWKTIEVMGYHYRIRNIDTFLFRNIPDTNLKEKWNISDCDCGTNLVTGNTQKEALAKARKVLKSQRRVYIAQTRVFINKLKEKGFTIPINKI